MFLKSLFTIEESILCQKKKKKKAFAVNLLDKTITKLFEAKIQHTKMHIVLPQVYKNELQDLSLIYFL